MIEQNLYNENQFEKVRDRIASIVYNELYSQLNLSIAEPNPAYEAFLRTFWDINKETSVDELNLYINRFIRPTIDEMNLIIVRFDNENFNPGSQIKDQRAKARYSFDVFVANKANDTSLGDSEAASICQKMLGILRSIIMHSDYIKLDFESGFIQRRFIENLGSFVPDEIESRTNSNNCISGSIDLTVEFDELNRGVTPVELQESYTNFNIDPNGKFKLETENLYV